MAFSALDSWDDTNSGIGDEYEKNDDGLDERRPPS